MLTAVVYSDIAALLNEVSFLLLGNSELENYTRLSHYELTGRSSNLSRSEGRKYDPRHWNAALALAFP